MLDPSAPLFSNDGRPRGTRASERRVSKRQVHAGLVFKRIRQNAMSLARLRGAARAAFIREKIATIRGIIRKRDLFQGDYRKLHHRTVHAANRAAGRRYIPGPFHGPVVLFLSRDRVTFSERDYRRDWMDLVPQAGSPIYVAGKNSGEMMTLPHVYELADVVNNQLEAYTKID